MPRRMPPLEVQFRADVDRSVQLANAGERIRALSPRGSVARSELSIAGLEALYETAYLRIFLRWEDFLEQTFLRYLCGYTCALAPCVLLNPPCRSLDDAQTSVLGTRDFVSWADPRAVVRRSQNYMTAAYHELVLNSDLVRLIFFKDVRNRIAHSSEFARTQFDAAVRALASRTYPGSSPGRFLRDRAVTIPAPKTWLDVISDELKNLAPQISQS